VIEEIKFSTESKISGLTKKMDDLEAKINEK
jgi:hypothetical protein